MVYEVVLIERPSKKEAEEGAIEKLILGPTAIVARDDKSAGVQAVLKHRDEIKSDLARVEVLVRPFC